MAGRLSWPNASELKVDEGRGPSRHDVQQHGEEGDEEAPANGTMHLYFQRPLFPCENYEVQQSGHCENDHRLDVEPVNPSSVHEGQFLQDSERNIKILRSEENPAERYEKEGQCPRRNLLQETALDLLSSLASPRPMNTERKAMQNAPRHKIP